MVKASFRFKFTSFYTKLILIQLDLKKDAAEKNVCKIALEDLLMAKNSNSLSFHTFLKTFVTHTHF